jgi:hypothetical protein
LTRRIKREYSKKIKGREGILKKEGKRSEA